MGAIVTDEFQRLGIVTGDDLHRRVARNRFGTFLAALCIDRVHLGDALYVARTAGAESEVASGTGVTAKSGTGGSISSILKGKKPLAQSPKRSTGNLHLGNVAVQAWSSHMQKMSESEPFARALGIPTNLIREAVSEISGAARRKKLNEEIALQLDRVVHIESIDAIIAKATLVAGHVLNNFVSTFGYDKLLPERRPTVPLGNGSERPIFGTKSTVHDASGIGEERSPFAFDFAVDWCTALQASLRENASSEDGSMQDPVQNAKLGKILERLETLRA